MFVREWSMKKTRENSNTDKCKHVAAVVMGCKQAIEWFSESALQELS